MGKCVLYSALIKMVSVLYCLLSSLFYFPHTRIQIVHQDKYQLVINILKFIMSVHSFTICFTATLSYSRIRLAQFNKYSEPFLLCGDSATHHKHSLKSISADLFIYFHHSQALSMLSSVPLLTVYTFISNTGATKEFSEH